MYGKLLLLLSSVHLFSWVKIRAATDIFETKHIETIITHNHAQR